MGPHLFAGLRVGDYRASRAWYDRLFGEPTFLPHDTEAVWTVADDRSIYIVEHPEAGHSVLLLFLDDLDAWVADVAGRGLEPTERETYSNGVRKAIYRDPDGNSVEFGGAPVEGGT
jgi:catechol 2,3-dioxygenase-like lactoylglutathione lyase family enzyme